MIGQICGRILITKICLLIVNLNWQVKIVSDVYDCWTILGYCCINFRTNSLSQ